MAMTLDPISQLDRFAASVLDSVRAPRPMPVDLFRDGDRYMMVADLPGIDPGSIDVDVDGQLLTIRAQRTVASGDDVTWITRERQSATFVRQLSLGQGVDTERIAASYDTGVLSGTNPVSEKARPRRLEVVSTARPEQVRTGEAAAE